MKQKLIERFMRYARVNTASDPHNAQFPTTARQKDLACLLLRELQEIGVKDVFLDESACILYAKLPSNLKDGVNATPVGFICHLDTSPEAASENIQPRLLENYDGGDIVLNEEKRIVMTARDFPNLQQYIGNDFIVTDGTTLLGADDKAGIAALICLAEYVCTHPAYLHGDICLAFTPDEEVGGLARDLNLARFGAPVAYTVDCDHLGHYSAETFYASEALITVKGLGVHPGTAKGIMKNAAEICAEFIAALPAKEKPQFTDGREGFFYIVSSKATCEEGRIELIIRDFDLGVFEQKQALIAAISEKLNARYGAGTVQFTIKEQYKNMIEVIRHYPYLTERLAAAIQAAGVTPVCEPFRGGTDGAELSFRGLPCPNLSAGYENAHGVFEYIPVQSMEKNVEILKKLVSLFVEE